MNEAETGDIIMFGGNTPTGFLLKFSTSSKWNHSGIAFRFNYINGKYILSKDKSGKLFIFETNTGERFDYINNKNMRGAAFSQFDKIYPNYNKFCIRKIKDEVKTEEFYKKSLEFTEKYLGIEFPSQITPFLSIWSGYDFNQDDNNKTMFCSQLMAEYYKYCFENNIKNKIDDDNINILEILFGSENFNKSNMIKPDDFSLQKSPNSAIFSDSENEILLQEGDILFVIFQAFIIIIFIIVILLMILPDFKQKIS